MVSTNGFPGNQQEDFIRTLFRPQDRVELRVIRDRDVLFNDACSADEFLTDDTRDAIKSWNDGGGNIYVGVHPRLKDQIGGDESVAMVRHLWFDFDKIPLPEIRDRVSKAELPEPTLIVHSGHGFHLYFALGEPTKDFDQVSRIVTNMKNLLGADHCQDLGRIFRLPGTLNVKDPDKIVECRIVAQTKTTYALTVFSKFDHEPPKSRSVKKRKAAKAKPAKRKHKKGGAKKSEEPKVEFDATDLPKTIEEWKTRLANAQLGERSDADYYFCLHCHNERIRKDRAWKICSGMSKFKTRGREYFETTWDNAKKVNKASRAKLAEKAEAQAEVDEDEPWGEPMPLRDVICTMPFPTTALPPVLKDFCKAVSAAVQVPVDMPAMAALGAVSASVSRKFTIEVEPDWIEYPNLYLTSFVESGLRKTNVVNKVKGPLIKAENDLREDWLANKHVWADTAELNESRAGKLYDEAKKVGEGGGDPMPTLTERALLLREAEELRRRAKSSLMLLTSDATPAALENIFANNGERIAFLEGESDLFDTLMANPEHIEFRLYLRAFVMEHFASSRVRRGDTHLFGPALTLCLMVQPDTIFDMRDTMRAKMRSSGFFARFLFSVPPTNVGSRKGRGTPVPASVQKKYDDTIGALLALPGGKHPADKLPVLKLSGEARDKIHEFKDSIEDRLGITGDLNEIQDWALKIVGNTVRVASAFHVVKNAKRSEPWATEISVKTINEAIRAARYFIAHAEVVYGRMGSTVLVGRARKILEWINGHRYSEVSKREIWKSLRATFPTTREFDLAVTVLQEHDIARMVSTGTRGRKKQCLRLNPLTVSKSFGRGGRG